MLKRVFFILLVMLSAALATRVWSATETYRTLPVENFNRQVRAAFFNEKEDWPGRAQDVGLQFLTDRLGDNTFTKIEITIDDRNANLVVIQDGFSGDSVRGGRHELQLMKERAGYWQLTEARYAWCCWSGRGHTWFSNEPCQ